MQEFCFIICTNNDILLGECLSYISRLFIPDGFTTNVITITEALSMTSGYNYAMHESNAKYKIYLHQDVFIINRFFLFNILDIFNSDETIGLIGMIGTPQLSSTAVMWFGDRNGILRTDNCTNHDERLSSDNLILFDSVAVDGAIIITSKDVSWREDIFDGWDFYDISECFEHRRLGNKVVVPQMNTSWCVHHDGAIVNLFNYDKYRKLFLEEYGSDSFFVSTHVSGSIKGIGDTNEEIEKLNAYLLKLRNNKTAYLEAEKRFMSLFEDALIEHNVSMFLEYGYELKKGKDNGQIFMTASLTRVLNIVIGVDMEQRMSEPCFLTDISSLNELMEKYTFLELSLFRIELCTEDEFLLPAYEFICSSGISPYMINSIISSKYSPYTRREYIMTSIAKYYISHENLKTAMKYMALLQI